MICANNSKQILSWLTLDKDKTGYITRNEFSTKAKKEIEKILSQSGVQSGYGLPVYDQLGYGQKMNPQHGSHGHPGYPPQQGYGNLGYPPKTVPGYGQKGYHH